MYYLYKGTYFYFLFSITLNDWFVFTKLIFSCLQKLLNKFWKYFVDLNLFQIFIYYLTIIRLINCKHNFKKYTIIIKEKKKLKLRIYKFYKHL